MIHLITVAGKSAGSYYLEQNCISDFKSLMRTITSGRVMMISTKFRSDLFYSANQSENNSILKSWALYAKTTLDSLDSKDIIATSGDEESLVRYFQSINLLASNWYHYRLYRAAFQRAFDNDNLNPMAMTVMQCDQCLIEHPSIKRMPLVNTDQKIDSKYMKDTFSLAMHIINSQTHAN